MERSRESRHGGGHVPTAMRAVWALGRLAVGLFYRVERIGPEVPAGPVLLVPNHPNGLLDPAVVVATSGRLPRFLAKSTLFAGTPYSFLIRWSGAIPVYRRQDTSDTARNAEMFEAVARALADGDAVCLFPEGITHSTGRLEPLKTGAARIVLTSEAQGTRVAVVAVGLNFTDKGIFRSPAIVAFGPAFSGRDLLREDDPLAPAQVDALTDRIAAHISDVLVEADPVNEAALVSRVERLYASARALPADAEARLSRERLLARGLATMRSRDPERLARIVGELRRHDRQLERFGLPPDVAASPPRATDAARFAARELPLGALLVPIAAAATIVFAVPYFLVDLAATRRGVEHEVQATVKVLGGALVHVVWVAALAAVAGWMWGLTAGAMTAVFLPALGMAGLFALEREAAVLDAARVWWVSTRLSPRTRRLLQHRRQELASLLEDAHAWVSSQPAGDLRPPDGARASTDGPVPR